MMLPTPAEVAALRADALKRHGTSRLLLVRLETPIDAAVVVSALDLKTHSAHVDARQANATTAASGIVVDRLLWCSPADGAAPTVDTFAPSKEDADPLHTVALDRLEALREAWPATDGKVDSELRIAAGANMAAAPVARLTEGSAPAGFQAPADAPQRGPGSLWLAVFGAGATAVRLVMRQPLPDVWTAGKAYFSDAVGKGASIVDASLRFSREHVV